MGKLKFPLESNIKMAVNSKTRRGPLYDHNILNLNVVSSTERSYKLLEPKKTVYEELAITDRVLIDKKILSNYIAAEPYLPHTHVVWKRCVKKNESKQNKCNFKIDTSTFNEEVKYNPSQIENEVTVKEEGPENNGISGVAVELEDENVMNVEVSENGCDKKKYKYYMKVGGRRIYKCEICEKMYSQLWILRNHILMHTGERPFKCPVDDCDATFNNSALLRIHQRTTSHHNWTYKCNQCSTAFRNKRLLTMHSVRACNKEQNKNKMRPT